MTRPTTRPEEVLALPLTHKECDIHTADETFYPRITANGSDAHTWTDTAAALVTMCNAYPLALALAEAAERATDALVTAAGCPDDDYWNKGGEGYEANEALIEARDAFLAHRQEADRG